MKEDRSPTDDETTKSGDACNSGQDMKNISRFQINFMYVYDSFTANGLRAGICVCLETILPSDCAKKSQLDEP